jgi:pantoate--beta-alanine ligase
MELCDAQTLLWTDRLDNPARLLAAAWVGGVRLIDNIAV